MRQNLTEYLCLFNCYPNISAADFDVYIDPDLMQDFADASNPSLINFNDVNSVNAFWNTRINAMQNILATNFGSCLGEALVFTQRGMKYFELSNHLGNVLTVVSDHHVAVASGGAGTPIEYYVAEITSISDYYPFGMVIKERAWTADNYRFGFNGKESDDEVNGNGNQYDYGFRIYNPRIAKFLSVDPLSKSYPWYTPFQFAGNKPIWAMDLDGLEEYITQFATITNSAGRPFIYKIAYWQVDPNERVNRRLGIVSNINEVDFKDFGSRVRDLKSTIDGGNKSILVRNRRLHTSIDRNYLGAMRKDGAKQNPSLLVMLSPKVMHRNDGGNTESKLRQNQFAVGQADNMAAVLIADGNSRINIIGSASRVATNIDGTEPETNEANNYKLAMQRTQAGKDLLISTLKDNYNKTDEEINALMTRVSTDSVVQGTGDDDEATARKYRYTKFEVK